MSTLESPLRVSGLPTPNPRPPGGAVTPAQVVDPLLFIHTSVLSDLEGQRRATQNRLGALTRHEGGWGLPASHPDVARIAALGDALAVMEHDAELQLKRVLRRCLIHPWVQAQVGLGEKQTARLLGVIGDPYWNLRDNKPRTVSALWAYCGLHVLPTADQTESNAHSQFVGGGDQAPGSGEAARRRRGTQSNWSTEAKTRAYLIATKCSMLVGGHQKNGVYKARSPYRDTYDSRRARTAVTHPEWTDGHSHNDALRITSKAILRDLWREAKRIHEGDQP